MDNPKYIRVRRISDHEEVHKVEATERNVERVMMGMLINMNTEEFYLDDSDFDEPQEEGAEPTLSYIEEVADFTEKDYNFLLNRSKEKEQP